MKQINYIAALALAAAMTACSNDFELPPMIVPQATMQPNTSIRQLKETYWESGRNYCSTIRTLDSGEDLIIKGRVISSDSTGNIFKNVVISDGTAAVTIAINSYDLYQSYQYGQNLVVNCTGLKIGGYNGLMQMGDEGTYNGAPSMTFMTKDLFDAHAQVDGLSNPKLVVPTVATIADLMAYKSIQDSLMAWQSRLVKIENVSFVNAGQAFAPTATTDRYVTDASGNRINVRCSSYATFKNDIIPGGTGSVTAILSYYGSDWQLMLNGLDGLEGFTPVAPSEPGAEPETPGTPTGEAVFKKATSIESGKQYIIVADGNLALPLDKNYGYLQIEAVTETEGAITVDASKAFTITASGEAYTIFAGGKYYYLSGTYNSFNVDASMPAEGALWSFTFAEDGKCSIANTSNSKVLQYDPQYKSYGCYSDMRGSLPQLYVKQ